MARVPLGRPPRYQATGGARARATRKFGEFVSIRKAQLYNSLVRREVLKAPASVLTFPGSARYTLVLTPPRRMSQYQPRRDKPSHIVIFRGSSQTLASLPL